MWPLTRRRARTSAPPDPAPSRTAYRVQRLLLTPFIRAFLRLGLPVFAVTLTAGVFVADEDRRQAIIDSGFEIKRQIVTRPEFMVHAMAIDGASDELVADIREIIPLDFPVSSFDLDLPGMQASVAGLDPVSDVRMHVAAGGILELKVVERMPAVVWRSQRGLELLDGEGFRIAGLTARSERPDHPLIAGPGADRAVPEALAIAAAAAPIAGRLRGLVRVGERRWDLALDRDQTIRLPAERPVAALEQVLALHQAQDLLERDIAVIDMRLPRRPTLRLADNARDELRRIRLIETGALAE